MPDLNGGSHDCVCSPHTRGPWSSEDGKLLELRRFAAFVPLTRFPPPSLSLPAWSFQRFPWMSAPIQVSLVGFW